MSRFVCVRHQSSRATSDLCASQALSEKGIATFRDLFESEPSRIELILNRRVTSFSHLPSLADFAVRNPPFGKKLVAQARSFPQFYLNITSEDGSEEALDIGVKLTLQVEVGLVVTSPPPQLKKGRARFWASILLVTSDGEYLECVPFVSLSTGISLTRDAGSDARRPSSSSPDPRPSPSLSFSSSPLRFVVVALTASMLSDALWALENHRHRRMRGPWCVLAVHLANRF